MCMNNQYGRMIGDTLRCVLDVNVEEGNTGWGKFCRIHFEINLTKSLVRGRSIQVWGKKYGFPSNTKNYLGFISSVAILFTEKSVSRWQVCYQMNNLALGSELRVEEKTFLLWQRKNLPLGRR